MEAIPLGWPLAAAGFLLSGWGRRLVGKGRARVVVLTVSTLSAVILIGRAVA